MVALEVLGVRPQVLAVPFGLADSTPLAEDRTHAEYDRSAVLRCWQLLTWASLQLEQQAGAMRREAQPRASLLAHHGPGRHTLFRPRGPARARGRKRHVGGLLT